MSECCIRQFATDTGEPVMAFELVSWKLFKVNYACVVAGEVQIAGRPYTGLVVVSILF